jgi:hypothetical protein
MAKQTCIFFISLFLLGSPAALSQDTVTVPLHIRAGFDISGPVLKLIDKDLISYGVLGSVDINSAVVVAAGFRYTTFNSSSVLYDFSSRGLSFTVGPDYNFIKANVARGKYYAGIGMRYGLSFYREEAPMISYTNKWGTGETFGPAANHTGHFIEITPGVRAELFPGMTIGWNLYMRLLVSAGAGKDLRPVWMPGYGAGTSGMTTGAEYFISLSIPYKKIKVFIKPRIQQTEDEEENVEETTQPGTGNRGFNSSFR